MIYSFAANEEEADGLLGEEEFETEGLDQSSRDFLDAAIGDYNALFGTSFDTSADKFQNYYKDLSQRLKKRDLDIAIVVNMFLTGFDATTLNTLWADKNLRAHGLIQAYSRTNRILNSVKTYGNIVSFRNLEQETNDALALFGNKEAKGIVLLKPFAEYYKEYGKRVEELVASFPLGKAQCIYWGDIDTHGFAILNRARTYIPSLKTVLMDESTLMSHRDLWVEEKDQHLSIELPLLTSREQQLYQSLRSNALGQHVRLEQERIRWDVAWTAIETSIR